jgi:hypothetical protein
VEYADFFFYLALQQNMRFNIFISNFLFITTALIYLLKKYINYYYKKNISGTLQYFKLQKK